MRIVLIRHFKVGFKWKFFYNSKDYEVDCGGYNSSPVIMSSLNFKSSDRLIASTMKRAMETSQFIFNREPDLSDENLCEVPIKPFADTRFKLPKLLWDVLGRLQWRLNMSRQPEPYAQSKKRVQRFLDSLITENRDVVIVCHGWIIKLLISQLKKLGFKGPSPVFIKNGVPYEYIL